MWQPPPLSANAELESLRCLDDVPGTIGNRLDLPWLCSDSMLRILCWDIWDFIPGMVWITVWATETVGASPPRTEEPLEPTSQDFKSSALLLQVPEVRICPLTTDVIFYQRLFQTDTWNFGFEMVINNLASLMWAFLINLTIHFSYFSQLPLPIGNLYYFVF